LSSKEFASDYERFKKLCFDIGSPKGLHLEVEEVLACGAVQLMAKALTEAWTRGRGRAIALFAMRRLLQVVASANTGVDPVPSAGAAMPRTAEGEAFCVALHDGAVAVVTSLQATVTRQEAPGGGFFKHAFAALAILARSGAPSALTELAGQKELITAVLRKRLGCDEAPFDELEEAFRLIMLLHGTEMLLDTVNGANLSKQAVQAACSALGDRDFESEESKEQLRPCAAGIAKMGLDLLSSYKDIDGASAPELQSVASALGVAAVCFDNVGELGSAVLRALLELMHRRVIDPARRSFGLANWTTWALWEAANGSAAALNILSGDLQTVQAVLQQVVTVLAVPSAGPAPADEKDGEAREALHYALSLMGLLEDSKPVIVVMETCTKSAGVQAAGSEALRTLLQAGKLRTPMPAQELASCQKALQQACASFVGKPEVETPANHALGLLMGAC